MPTWKVQSTLENEDIVSEILKIRGLTKKAEIATFLNPPPIKEWVTKLPTDFKDSLKKAKKLIEQAIKNETPIIIHGDYDADGICATAILYNTLKKELNYDKTFYMIPNRFDHGYGLSQNSIDTAIQQVSNPKKAEKPKKILFITVDSGITATDEVEYIKQLGHDVIITDHHQKPKKLPKPDCLVWNDQMVGAAVSWLLARTIGSKDAQSISLAALATVTDLQPVLDFNRTVVKAGLQVLNKNPPLGLNKLLQVAGRTKYEITTYDLGWVVGPRLNATGRMIEASESLKLLIEDDKDAVEEIAENLNQVNTQRQEKTFEMYDLAQDVDKENLPKIIFSHNEKYHEGIIGLVAARLVQKHYRPAVVISLSDGYGKGSVRSVRGVDIISILREFDELFEELGGHPMAAGFSIKKENIGVLEKKMLAYADENIGDELLQKVLNIDLKIPVELVNLELLKTLETLKPFGIGNEEPVFLSEGLGVTAADKVGAEGKHLSLKLLNNGDFYKAIWFYGGEKDLDFGVGDKVDVVYNIKKNEYNGRVYVDLVVKDLRKSGLD